MSKSDCLFCRIVAQNQKFAPTLFGQLQQFCFGAKNATLKPKSAPAEVVYEDREVLAFKDIKPAAPIHLLIVPKKHIDSIKEVQVSETKLIGKLILVAQKIAAKQQLSGYKLIFNVGKDGGQVIFHLHLHLLGGFRP